MTLKLLLLLVTLNITLPVYFFCTWFFSFAIIIAKVVVVAEVVVRPIVGVGLLIINIGHKAEQSLNGGSVLTGLQSVDCGFRMCPRV